MSEVDLIIITSCAGLFVVVFCGFKFFAKQQFFTAAKNAAYVCICLFIAVAGLFNFYDNNVSVGVAIEVSCAVFLVSKYVCNASLLRALGITIICASSLLAISAFMATSNVNSRGMGVAGIIFIPFVWGIAVAIAALLLWIDKKRIQ